MDRLRLNNIFLFRVTEQWGWNCRSLASEMTTEFYSIYRHVAAEKAKIRFREHIIAEINALLARLGVKCAIEVHGLPSVGEVGDMKHGLVTGELSFTEFLNRIYSP
jgi:hypothetical protein